MNSYFLTKFSLVCHRAKRVKEDCVAPVFQISFENTHFYMDSNMTTDATKKYVQLQLLKLTISFLCEITFIKPTLGVGTSPQARERGGG